MERLKTIRRVVILCRDESWARQLAEQFEQQTSLFGKKPKPAERNYSLKVRVYMSVDDARHAADDREDIAALVVNRNVDDPDVFDYLSAFRKHHPLTPIVITRPVDMPDRLLSLMNTIHPFHVVSSDLSFPQLHGLIGDTVDHYHELLQAAGAQRAERVEPEGEATDPFAMDGDAINRYRNRSRWFALKPWMLRDWN